MIINHKEIDVSAIESKISELDSQLDNALTVPVWNISDEIYSEITDLGITLPSDITSAYDTVFGFTYVNNILYVLAKKTSDNYPYMIEYDGSTCTTTLMTRDIIYSATQLIEFNGSIYVSCNYSNYYYQHYLYKYDIENKTFTQVKYYYVYQDTSHSMSTALVKDVKNNALYWICLNTCSSTSYAFHIIKYDGNTFTAIDTTIKLSKYSIHSAYISNDKLIINVQNNNASFNYMNYVFNLSDLSYVQHNITKNSRRFYAQINDKIFVTLGSYGLAKAEYLEYRQIIKDMSTQYINSYDNLMYTYNAISDTVKQIKPYRVAKSYATKGSKIYLSGEHKPLTDNLQAIDNGYEVTSNGEVKIALYE